MSWRSFIFYPQPSALHFKKALIIFVVFGADIVPSYQNEVLPEGWKELTHNTGMPIYCHIASRVVTWSRPYFLENRYAKVSPEHLKILALMLHPLYATFGLLRIWICSSSDTGGYDHI